MEDGKSDILQQFCDITGTASQDLLVMLQNAVHGYKPGFAWLA